jgi:predicted ATPase
MRFEIEIELQSLLYTYSLALELPPRFQEPRVFEESLRIGSDLVFARDRSEITLYRADTGSTAQWGMDWHLAALPVVQEPGRKDRISTLRTALARAVILQPIPSRMRGDSEESMLEPDFHLENFSAWLTGVIAHAPSSYAVIEEYLRQVLPELTDLRNPLVGRDRRSWEVTFSADSGALNLRFDDLSDGEKCFVVCAAVLAANRAYGPLLCFWDEPENHLALSEVSQFIAALRRSFHKTGGQFIATSHNPEAITAFPEENTLVLERRSRLEPTTVRTLRTMRDSHALEGSLVGALVRGDF